MSLATLDLKELQFFACLALMATFSLWGSVSWLKRWRMRRWLRVPGRVEDVDVVVLRPSQLGNHCQFDIKVAYTLLQRDYVTRRFDPNPHMSTHVKEWKARRMAAAYPPGRIVELWVKPTDPSEAYVRRTPRAILALMTFLGPIFIALLFLAYRGIFSHGDDHPAESWQYWAALIALVGAAIATFIAALTESDYQ